MDLKMKLIIGIVVLLVVLVLVNKYGSMETFYTLNSFYKKYCPSCGWRSRRTCSSCLNCGYCITAEGQGECVAGNSSGPYFRNDCAVWEYGDAYQYYPYANLYPVTKVKSINPYFQKEDKKPYKWVPVPNGL
jgi:hypothetical protein